MTKTHCHARPGAYSPEYETWRAMKARCHSPNSTSYHKYGAKGVKVCERWRHSFELFLEDMGPRPFGKTIDRFPDKTGNYEPGNCRWSSVKEQQNNKTSNRIIEVGGNTMTLMEASERLNINYHTLKSRLNRGWSVEKSVQPFGD